MQLGFQEALVNYQDPAAAMLHLLHSIYCILQVIPDPSRLLHHVYYLNQTVWVQNHVLLGV